MSYLWIIRFSILISLQIITSLILIYKGNNKISYLTEILLSICSASYAYFIVPKIMNRGTLEIIEYIYKDHSFTSDKFLWYIAEYLILKLLIIFLVWILKYFSFFALVSINKRKGILAKIGYKIFGKKRFIRFTSRMWNKVDYGIRIKKGMPGRVNKKHRKTGIYFDQDGFPEFEAIETVKLQRRLYNKTREVHFYHCNKILYDRIKKDKSTARKFTKTDIECFKKGETPTIYTWHHHQKKGVLQLVNREVHESVNHCGGYSIWGKKGD